MELKRKNVVIGFVLMISASLWFFSYKTLSHKKNNKLMIDIRHIEISSIKGEEFNFKSIKSKDNTVFIFFSSTCDFCSFEMEQVVKRINEFGSTNIIFISDEPIDVLQKVSDQYKIDSFSNIEIYKCDHEYLISSFGEIAKKRPATLVFNEEGQLLKSFSGAIHLDKVLTALKQTQ